MQEENLAGITENRFKLFDRSEVVVFTGFAVEDAV